MKFYTIALFLFCFNLLMGLVTPYTLTSAAGWESSQEFSYLGDSAAAVQSGTEYGDAISMGALILTSIGEAVFVPGYFLNTFGFPWAADIATALTWFVYLIGLYQYFSNRGFKQYE